MKPANAIPLRVVSLEDAMIEWIYAGVGWFDYWTTRCGSAMIARHPNHDRGDYVVWINGTRVAQANELRLAQYKTEKILRGDAR